MATRERRREERKEQVIPVSVVTSEVVLEGQTVNVSSNGLCFTARERLPLVVDVQGKKYHARLVRAFPTTDQTWYAVELDALLDTTDPSVDGSGPS